MAARVCGVLGDPIAHSLSPVLHRAGYAAVGLDWSYDAHRVPSGSLPEFLASCDEPWRGLSLTMPLKREAVPLVDTLTERARRAGAVNTLVLEHGTDGLRLHGDNTDIPGAVSAVRERWSGTPERATVLGGGATATSTGLALAEMGVRHVDLLVRTPERAVETVEVLTAEGGTEVSVHLLDDPVEPGDVVVSTVPASAQTPQLVERMASAALLFDVIYDPWPTPLASAVAGTGVVVSGLDLLVHQAAVQFTLFTGVEAPLGAMRAAGEAALAARAGQGSH